MQHLIFPLRIFGQVICKHVLLNQHSHGVTLQTANSGTNSDSYEGAFIAAYECTHDCLADYTRAFGIPIDVTYAKTLRTSHVRSNIISLQTSNGISDCDAYDRTFETTHERSVGVTYHETLHTTHYAKALRPTHQQSNAITNRSSNYRALQTTHQQPNTISNSSSNYRALQTTNQQSYCISISISYYRTHQTTFSNSISHAGTYNPNLP